MGRAVRTVGRGLIAALLCTVASAASAQGKMSEEEYFRGKSMRMIVGSGTGGGFDTYARMIAPFLAKLLDATMVVENQPGAGNIRALNNLAAAAPDGLRIMLANGSAGAMAQFVGQTGVRYDLAKFGHLGTIVASPAIWLVGPKSEVTSPLEIIAAGKTISWSGSGPTGSSDGAAFTCAVFKLSCKIIIGYSSSNDAILAVARGEVDGISISDISANNAVKSGSAKAIATMDRERSRFFPDTPTVFELVKVDADQEWLLDFRSTIESLGRILIAPPDLPPERLEFLRATVRKALQDPELIAQGERTQYFVSYHDAELNRRNAERILDKITPEERSRVTAILATVGQ